MEIQLQELLEKIKSNGVAVAEQEATAILEAANAKAEEIVSSAKEEADRILCQARDENARMVKSSEDAIRQAGRNLLISFRKSVTKELDAIIGAQVAQAYDPETLVKLIPTVVESWAGNTDAEELSVLLNPSDLAAVEGTLLAALKERLQAGVTLKCDDRLNGGFRIAAKDSGAYYDFSSDAVAEMFATCLNPKVAALLKEAGNV